ncbi:MAG: sugar phosphate isomerase/epimerase [Desulfofustis sp.]|nr:sugar phosphate isomerase/epimerase [Desulfofustis sp.]
MKIYIFSKHLQFLDYPGMSEAAREMGFDGIDLTVRPKGHVLPERVSIDLPMATEAMHAFGLATGLFTSKVMDATNLVDRNVLETAAGLGYDFYRTGWYKYERDREIRVSFGKFREKLSELSSLSGSLGISGSYQNHSGHYFGSSIWELDEALEGLPVGQMGCQYDIMHANIEGGKNWEIGFRLIREHINSLVLKDFKWGRMKGVWKPVPVPAGQGMVDFPGFFSLLKRYGINVPVSVHCEYDLGGAEHGSTSSVDSRKVMASLKQDLDYYRQTWESTG